MGFLTALDRRFFGLNVFRANCMVAVECELLEKKHRGIRDGISPVFFVNANAGLDGFGFLKRIKN